VGIGGGAESLSDIPILHSRRMTKVLMEASRARSLGERLAAFARVRPRDLQPEVPAIAEPSTGLTMGQSAEKMAKENGISREEQDHIALRSHLAAAAATDEGRLAPEVCAVLPPPRYEPAVTQDNLIRRDTSLEALAKLPPVFDRKYGTVTAGNSSPLTDGAAAVLLMSEKRARAEGFEPLAFIRSWAVAAVDPGGQLLMGPALAVPKALERAGVTLADMDLIEMHEAFAAQVASNIQALESESWARKELGRPDKVGTVDPARLNVNGGSIAIGHPFGATGARLTTTLAREMKRRDAHLGLISVCAAGGLGFAMVLER
jgi:acetyl-CoA acyltransferase